MEMNGVTFKEVRPGVYEVPVHKFDACGTLYRVATPIEARVGKSTSSPGSHTADYWPSGYVRSLVRGAAFPSPKDAINGLLRNMAQKYQDDPLVKGILKGIIEPVISD